MKFASPFVTFTPLSTITLLTPNAPVATVTPGTLNVHPIEGALTPPMPVPGIPVHAVAARTGPAIHAAVARKRDLQPHLTLTDTELEKLVEYEQEIATGFREFIPTATAVYRIHSESLYRPHRSITDYCSARWNFSKHDTSHYKQAGEVLVELQEFPTRPSSVSQCHELSKLPPGTRARYWQYLIEIAVDGKIRCADIAQLVKDEMSEEPKLNHASTLRKLNCVAKTLSRISSWPMTQEIEDKLDEIAGLIGMALHAVQIRDLDRFRGTT
jgi:hypothetical protein